MQITIEWSPATVTQLVLCQCDSYQPDTVGSPGRHLGSRILTSPQFGNILFLHCRHKSFLFPGSSILTYSMKATAWLSNTSFEREKYTNIS